MPEPLQTLPSPTTSNVILNRVMTEPPVTESIPAKNLRWLTADPWRMAVLALGVFFATFITQSLPFWDGDFTIFFTAIQNKTLVRLFADLINPVTQDTRNWGFLDHTVQLIIYKISFLLVGWDSWPYVWFRIFCYAGIGIFIYQWVLRLVASDDPNPETTRRARQAAAAAALFFLVCPAPVASMSWIADFAPVAEFAFAALTFLIWAEIERTPLEWTEFNPVASPERRTWLSRWLILTVAIYFAYKTKSDLKLIPPVTVLYLALTRHHQWKVFATPLTLMAFLAIPWNTAIFQRLPPFVPGAEGGSENFMWQPAKLGRLAEFFWASNPYNLREASLSLASHLGPFLLVAVAFLFILSPLPAGTFPKLRKLTFDSRRSRAHLYLAIWFCAILAGATALPEINYYFRIRYGILPLVPVSILLGSAFGWFAQSAKSLPRWIVAFALILFGIQFTVNLDRSLRYRRSFGATEVGVNQAYAWIAKYFPDQDLVLMPDFLPYDYHLDAPPAIRNRHRSNGLDELSRLYIPNRTTVISWQPPNSPVLKEVARFNGCSPDSLFDRITGCPPSHEIHVSRYIGPAPGEQLQPTAPRTEAQQNVVILAQNHLNASFQACREHKPQVCIAEAREAISLLPNFPEAYNNLAAGYETLGLWDKAIEAANQALRLKPDFQLAKNNLAWSLSQKKINAPPPPQ